MSEQSKSELFTRAAELGLEPKKGTPNHILQRMIDKVEEARPGTGSAVISVGEEIKKPIDLAAEVNIAYASKEDFDADLEAEIRKKVANQLREEEIRKELQAAAALERKMKRELKKYDLTYDLADLQKQADAILGARGKFTLQLDRGTYHVVVGGYACAGNLAQEKRFILRDCQHALTLRPPKMRINDLGQTEMVADLEQIQVEANNR